MSEFRRYYAIMHDNGKVIAEAETHAKCSEFAEDECPWSGPVAPYYITTARPPICSLCHGRGKVSDGYDWWDCGGCDGSGYSLTKYEYAAAAPSQADRGRDE